MLCIPTISRADNSWDFSNLGVSKDWMEQGTNAKNKNAPTSRLKKLTECAECQAKVDRLQALLDAWYLAEYKAGADERTAGDRNPDQKEGDSQHAKGKAMQKDAASGLGGLSEAEIKKKAGQKPDPNIPQDPGKLADAVKNAAADLQKCLDDCKKKAATPPPETPPVTEQPVTPPKEEPKAEHVIGLDFVINKGAEITPADVDEALKKVNEAFAASGVGFTRKTFTPANNPKIPQTPESGKVENEASDQQKDVAKEAEKIAKGLPEPHGTITVKVVENFKRPEGGGSKISGIEIGDTVLIADPFHVQANSFGQDNFSHVLAHELGHVLGLEHEVLKSDKESNYANQKEGRYEDPNAMGNGMHGGSAGEFSKDQIDVIKKKAVRFYEKPATTTGGGGQSNKGPKRRKKHARREDDPLYMEGYQPVPTRHSHSSGSGNSGGPTYVVPGEGEQSQPEEDQQKSPEVPNPYDQPRPDIPVPPH